MAVCADLTAGLVIRCGVDRKSTERSGINLEVWSINEAAMSIIDLNSLVYKSHDVSPDDRSRDSMTLTRARHICKI